MVVGSIPTVGVKQKLSKLISESSSLISVHAMAKIALCVSLWAEPAADDAQRWSIIIIIIVSDHHLCAMMLIEQYFWWTTMTMMMMMVVTVDERVELSSAKTMVAHDDDDDDDGHSWHFVWRSWQSGEL